MNWWQAVILGLVEGITEYLPVSSTGHLVLTSALLGLYDSEARKASVNDFEIVIQGGAILAVLGLYLPRFVQMLAGVLGRDRAGLRLLTNLAIAFVPAAVAGLLLEDLIDAYLMRPSMVAIAIIVGGVYMIAVDWYVVAPARREARTALAGGRGAPVIVDPRTAGGREVTELTPGGALLVGALQILALWPGTSRSMMTITGGVFAGLRPAAAAEFSFLLGMPTLLAATGYKLTKNLLHARQTGQPTMFQELGYVPCALGVAVAAVSAALAVRWLVGFLNRHGLAPFGYYRLALGAALCGAIWLGVF